MKFKHAKGTRGTRTQRDNPGTRQQEGGHLLAEERGLRWVDPAGTLDLILDFQPPELWENKCLLYKPPGLQYFVWEPSHTNTTHQHMLAAYRTSAHGSALHQIIAMSLNSALLTHGPQVFGMAKQCCSEYPGPATLAQLFKYICKVNSQK